MRKHCGRINPADGTALTQLNLITSNRNAVAHTAVSEDIILLERRRELCFEGFRFHDLARTHRNIPNVSPLSADSRRSVIRKLQICFSDSA